MQRGSGILMHITSLPGAYGIGTFGKSAYEFVDFLRESRQKYWQILPLGPTSYGDSPYQSFSSHAINPYFIDFDFLRADGLLEESEYSGIDFGDDPLLVDYYKVFINRIKVLRLAFDRAKNMIADQVNIFSEQNHHWLHDYAMYMSIKNYFGLREWSLWDEDIKRREPRAMDYYAQLLKDEIEFWKFTQYMGYSQWLRLKQYANDRAIRIIGDIPIYAAYDSADTWAFARSGIFKFDEALKPTGLAGCPPDYFSPDGQYWGNPVYDWAKNKETGYSWWMDRLRTSFRLYDIVRIDHFRGFVNYWEIPYGAPTAASGKWVDGPKDDFIDAIASNFGELDIIAEDLGFLTEEVFEFNKRSGYPGMKVLEFAFDAGGEASYLPHNYDKSCIVYTGTHDNDTVRGWFSTASQKEIDFATDYLRLDEKEEYHWSLIRASYGSVANMAIIPIQDILGLGSESRMNTPATIGGLNWRFRVTSDVFTEDISKRLEKFTMLYAR